MDIYAKLISNNEQGQANARDWWLTTPEADKERLVESMLQRIRQGTQDDTWVIYRLAWLKFSELAEEDLRMQAESVR